MEGERVPETSDSDSIGLIAREEVFVSEDTFRIEGAVYCADTSSLPLSACALACRNTLTTASLSPWSHRGREQGDLFQFHAWPTVMTSERSRDTCHARRPRHSLSLSLLSPLSLSRLLIRASLFTTLRKLVGSRRAARQGITAPGTPATRIDLILRLCLLSLRLKLINRVLKRSK